MAMVKPNRIVIRAMQDRKLQFTSLSHHINTINLWQCYFELKKNKACGIDGATVESYGKDLNENLDCLVERLKSKRYQPQPVRRVYIPKAGKNEKRGLGIPTVEDKLVQLMLKKILESIYETDFLSCSFGFRPNLSAHHAIKALNTSVMYKPTNYVVEVDIRRFFDNVSHYWLQRCLEERIKDKNFLFLIRKFLKSGVVENGQYMPTDVGTPQGGVISPLLANIYLHYVLDLWFEKKFKSQSKGYVELIRYCDDFVVCCESKADAEKFQVKLKQRLSKFGLSVAEDKTSMLRFGRRAWTLSKRTKEKVGTFNFLGFTHYCAKSRYGKFMMVHKTSKQNLSRKLKEIKEWIKAIRNRLPLKEWLPILRAKLSGHYNYFGVSGNSRCLRKFYQSVQWLLFKWINRRSQKKSMSIDRYWKYLDLNPLPQPRIRYALY